MIQLTQVETFSKIVYNFVLALSFIVGAYWTLFIYTTRHEEVTIDVKIDSIELKFFKGDTNKYLNINVVIRNRGKRDVELYFDSTEVKIISANHDGTWSNKPIDIIKDLPSLYQRHHGRLRSGTEIKIPYWRKINDLGLYFIEFNIPIDMDKYYGGFSFKKNNIITWSDRKYYLAK
jgi:hypothetical protein